MNKYLFIAEKPSAMKAVKAAYDNNTAAINAKVGLIDFTALAGHVCAYLEPSQYPKYKGVKWQDMDLPLVLDDSVTNNGPSGQKKLDTIEDMLKKNHYDGIIVGTDSDVEGNGIYYLVSKYLKLQHYKTLRFFEQSLTEKEILKSLYSMTDFYSEPRDVNMTNSYIVRSLFDRAVGMNATVAVTVKSGLLYKVGRVKAPTLKLVYDNCEAIDNFKPHSDYLVKATYKEGFTGTLYDGADVKQFATEAEAKAFIAKIAAKTADVYDVTRKEVSTPAPQLYKLSTLQVEAGSEFSYNPEKTLELVQSLYEKHYVSYPRTDGVYVSTEMAKDFINMLRGALHVPELAPYVKTLTQADVARVSANKRVVNDAEVKKSSHTALLPDQLPDFTKMSEDEKNIYVLICKRLLAQFLPELKEEKTVLWADIAGDKYKSTGSIVLTKGWTELYNKTEKAEKIPNAIKNGDKLNIDKIEPSEKKAAAPKRLTTASLVDAMENIAKYIEDKQLKKIMKDAKGLGTPATRAGIINDLIDTGYMSKKGKNEALYISETGKKYIQAIGGFSIVDPAQSAKFETMFQEVKEGIYNKEAALAECDKFVKKFIEDVASAPIARSSKNSLGKCPYCGSDVVEQKWGFGCLGYKSGCTFSVSSNNGKVKAKDVVDLISKGKTKVIKNVIHSVKTGKDYDGVLVLQPKGSKYTTSIEFANTK